MSNFTINDQHFKKFNALVISVGKVAFLDHFQTLGPNNPPATMESSRHLSDLPKQPREQLLGEND